MNQVALAIHGAMLADQARNAALADGIAALVRPGSVVVDVGAGSGLLAMLCVRAGARRVYALERSTMALLAARLIERNRMSAQIELVQVHSRAWRPPEQADVILCETLGFAALDEGFRASMVDARERMLRPGGALLPRSVRILAAPVQAAATHPELPCLDTLLGLDYRPFASVMRTAVQRCYIACEHELAAARTLFELDCATMPQHTRLVNRATFPCLKSGALAGFALWFDAELAPGIHLHNRSPDPHNHWGQAYLPLGTSLSVEAGTCVTLELEMSDSAGSLSITWRAALASREVTDEVSYT